MLTSRRKYSVAAMALILGGSFLSACTSNDDAAAASSDDPTEASTNFDLSVPQGTPPEKGWPLLVVAGEDGARVAEAIPDEDPTVLLMLPEKVNTEEKASASKAAHIIFSVREQYEIADTRVYGLSTGADDDVTIEALEAQYPGMFAGVGLVQGKAELVNSIGVVPQLTVSEDSVEDVVEELLAAKRSDIYDAAILAPGISDDRGSDEVRAATDGNPETLYEVGDQASLTLTFPQPMILHRWTMAFGERPSQVTLETTSDGVTWVELDTATVMNDRLDRYAFAPHISAVRVTAQGGQIADLGIYTRIADETRFSYEHYEGKNISLPYRLFVPEGAPANLPVVVFLTGSGQRGVDEAQHLGVTKGEGAVRWASDAEQAAHPSIVVAPQIPMNKLWRDPDVMEGLNELIAEVVATHHADPDRVYGTGLSIGAEGLLNVSILYPDVFAALLPVAGGPNNPVGGGPAVIDTVVPYAAQYAHIPIWEMQSFDDSVRPFSKTIAMINALRAQGASPRLTIYLPGVTQRFATSTHSSWTMAYADPRIGEWLFAQNRQNRPVLGDPLPSIPEITGEELIELAGPGALYYEFE
ncbi:MAG: PHB depolymerase family esterase [Ancrocorticia sp.]